MGASAGEVGEVGKVGKVAVRQASLGAWGSRWATGCWAAGGGAVRVDTAGVQGVQRLVAGMR